MFQCQGCEGFLVAAEGTIRCSRCPGEFHPACIGDFIDDNGYNICRECINKQELYASANAPDANSSQPVESEIVCRGLNRELTCVLFPGVVKNVDKALQCMGGIKNISQVYNQSSKKRLGLSFQPDNPFIKKVYADNRKTSGVLLRVKVKKIKVDNQVKREVISTDVVGRVSCIYRFDSMCDFQYLPVSREGPEEPLKCLIENIIPSGCDTVDFLSDSGNTPLYIVPASFTRSDRPISYAYTDKRYPDRSGSPDGDSEYHNKSRTERGMPLGHWWRFNLTDEFPTAPDEQYLRNRDHKAEYNTALKKEYEIIYNYFQERPIWSLNMIRFTTKMRLTSLKVLVPCVAIYMKDGPWKSLWVRYGFDPRKEPSALIYQTLDFRLRHTAGVHSMVTTRDQLSHYKGTERVRRRRNRSDPQPAEEVPEGAVVFRPGIAPTQRQIFYQLCDVKLPEVERLISEASAKVTTCHEKLGWLPANAIYECRDLLFRSVKTSLLATHSEELKYEDGDGGSSDDEDNSGDDITNAMDESI